MTVIQGFFAADCHEDGGDAVPDCEDAHVELPGNLRQEERRHHRAEEGAKEEGEGPDVDLSCAFWAVGFSLLFLRKGGEVAYRGRRRDRARLRDRLLEVRWRRNLGVYGMR